MNQYEDLLDVNIELNKKLSDLNFESIVHVEQMIKTFMSDYKFTATGSIRFVDYIGEIDEYVMTFSREGFEIDIDAHIHINYTKSSVSLVIFYPKGYSHN